MNIKTRTLTLADMPSASQLDKQWFGENGISIEELKAQLLKNPHTNIGIFENDKLMGFAFFELLKNTPPRDYVGVPPVEGKVLFIQQFTTTTNYRIDKWEVDEQLLKELEIIAVRNLCMEIWEALSVNHPYSKEINNKFDAYGFYKSQGYKQNIIPCLAWQPNSTFSIPCTLFIKSI